MLSPIAHKEEDVIGNINENELDGRAVKSLKVHVQPFKASI